MLDSMVCELMAQIFSMADTTSGKSILLPQNSDFKSSDELNNNQTIVVNLLSESKYELPDKQVSEDTTLSDQPKEELYLISSKLALIFVYVIFLLCWIVNNLHHRYK